MGNITYLFVANTRDELRRMIERVRYKIDNAADPCDIADDQDYANHLQWILDHG